MDFSKELKIGTKKSHSAAENTSFVASFLRGVVNKESYKKLVSDLYFVYSTMEEEVDNLKDHPIIGQIQLSNLNRVNALEQDLRFYYGPIWRSIIQPSEACNQYVNRIREVAKNEPELLVGHHYTRYLGDLSGGQILKGIAEKALELVDGQGLKFYDFEKIEDTKAYKAGYRGILDGLPITENQKNAIIGEANYAFKLNMDMFNSLEGNWFQSLLQIFISFIFKKK
jgi:heme oxygenase|tara:strand:+ start:1011 stop:1688 length:678 start_codon:yes stop_codon:yes gene_type:complete